jgi:hypothetical protein
MEASDENLRKHLNVAVRAMKASLNSFPLSYAQQDASEEVVLTLTGLNGATISATVYSCPDPTDPTGKRHIIQNTPCR